jgi:ketosteroid isomerase-like protein
MPTSIADLIRDALAAYARGGFGAVAPLVHQDIEIFAPPELINSGEARGQGEAASWIREWGDAWQAERYEIKEIEQIAPDRAVASMRVSNTGRSSGITTEMRQWWFFETRDGKIARWHLYPDREQAYAVAGTAR